MSSKDHQPVMQTSKQTNMGYKRDAVPEDELLIGGLLYRIMIPTTTVLGRDDSAWLCGVAHAILVYCGAFKIIFSVNNKKTLLFGSTGILC